MADNQWNLSRIPDTLDFSELQYHSSPTSSNAHETISTNTATKSTKSTCSISTAKKRRRDSEQETTSDTDTEIAPQPKRRMTSIEKDQAYVEAYNLFRTESDRAEDTTSTEDNDNELEK